MNDAHNLFARYLKATGSSVTQTGAPWVIATLIAREGSSYRKEGAMMFVSPIGERIGVLSGGCLEDDIIHQAYRVSATGKPKVVHYDSLDDDSFSGANNTGCLGRIQILLNPVTVDIHDQIVTAYDALESGKTTTFEQAIPNVDPGLNRASWALTPRHRFLVIGAGHDAVPICTIAKQMGWHVTLWDDRPKWQQHALKNIVDHYVTTARGQLNELPSMSYDGVLLKTHNLSADAIWLKHLEAYQQSFKYIALLGPQYRRQMVIDEAKLISNEWALQRVHAPAGIDIGGDSPEAIALSVLSQAHQSFHR